MKLTHYFTHGDEESGAVWRPRVLVVLFATCLVTAMLCRCAPIGAQANAQQAALAQGAATISTQAASASTHTQTAVTAVAAATKVATSIPAAAPVLPPLATASTALAGVQADIASVKASVTALTSQLNGVASTVSKLTTANASLTETNAKLIKRWDAAWLGGRAWFWIYWIAGLGSLVFFGLFALEFFGGMNIHPLTWVVEAIPVIAKGTANLASDAWGATTTAWGYVTSLFKAKAATPAAPAPLAPPVAIPVAPAPPSAPAPVQPAVGAAAPASA